MKFSHVQEQGIKCNILIKRSPLVKESKLFSSISEKSPCITPMSSNSLKGREIAKQLENSSQILERKKRELAAKETSNIFSLKSVAMNDPLVKTSNSFFKRNFFDRGNAIQPTEIYKIINTMRIIFVSMWNLVNSLPNSGKTIEEAVEKSDEEENSSIISVRPKTNIKGKRYSTVQESSEVNKN